MAKYVAYGEVTFTSSIEPFSVILSNEAQQIVTDSSRVVQSSQEYYTDIIIFQGATERTDFTIGDISSASNITVSKSSNRVTFTVNEGVTLQSDAGTFDIPVLLDDKTVTKTFSWSCAKQGTDGSAAKIVDVTASSQIFKSTDGGATFTPETITLTPTFQGGIAYLRWQYSSDGGISWTDVNGSTNGVSVSTGVLTLKNTSTLFTDKISSIPFKCLSDNTSYYDVMTIAKLYDPEDIQNQLTTITNTISGVSSKVDNVEKSIVNKVWQTDITSKINEYNNTTVKEIVDRVTKTETDINGVTTTVSTMKTNYDGQITSLETKQIQTDSKLGWLVSSGTSSSDFTLTDRTAELVSTYINLHGLVTFKGLSSDVNGKFTKYDGWGGTTDSTKINGAMIETGSINAEQIAANAITAIKIAANAVTADKISAYGLSVLHKTTGEKTLEIDASGNVNLNVNSLQIASKDVPTKTEVTQSIKDLQIGGRNLFLKTGIEISNNDYNMAMYRPASKPLSAGEIYTATLCVTPAKNDMYFTLYFSNGNMSKAVFDVNGTNKQIISETFTMDYAKDMTPDKNIDYANASLYRFPNDGTVTENSTIHWIKIEKGNKATDWTPAPEDLTADVQAKADEALASAKTYADAQIKVSADSINQNVTKVQAASIISSQEQFYQSTSPTSLTGGSWSNTQPAWANGKYIWRRTLVTYGNNKTGYTPSETGVCITGNTGATGKGIKSTAVTYQASSSGTTVPTGTWVTSVPTVFAGKYLWTRTIITYTDNTTSTSYSVGKMGRDGSVGAGGNLIQNGYGEFLDNTNFSGGTFTKGDCPEGAYGYFTCGETNAIPFDTSKIYDLEFYVRKHAGASGDNYFSIYPLDIDGNEINFCNVLAYNKNLFYLAKDLNVGDTIVYFEDLSKWIITTAQTYQRSFLFFGYQDGTGYTYPDGTYSRYYYSEVYADNSSVDLTNNAITLTKAWNGRTFKAGTCVGQASDGSTHCYYGQAGSITNTDWDKRNDTVFAGDGNGKYAVDSNSLRLLYAKYIRINLFNNNADYSKLSLREHDSTVDNINDKLTELRQEVNSNIEQTGEAIKSSVYEKVYLKDDVDTLFSSVNTEVEQTKTSWQVTFNQLVNQLNDYSDGSDAAFDEIRKYIRFEDGNILLGNSSSPLILRIRNDRIQFLQNGYEVAYISDQKMYNTTCEIINQLRIADSAWTVEYNASGDTVISLVGI